MLISIYFLVLLILEIVVIIRAVNEKNKKYFKVFNGLFFGFFVSIFFYFLYFLSDVYSYDIGGWCFLGAFFQSMFFCMINLVIGVIGLIIQKLSKKKKFIKTLKKGITIKYILIVSVISFFIIFSQFIIKYTGNIKVDNKVKEETMVYLKDKYGSEDFEIIDIDREFVDSGWIETDRLEYYEVNVLYKELNIEFNVELYVDDKRNILRDSSEDWFLFAYYGKEFNDEDFRAEGNYQKDLFFEYLKDKGLNVEVEMSDYYASGASSEKILPRGYGKIPTKNEFYNLVIDYQLKHEMTIVIDENELIGKDLQKELRDYLVNLASYIIDYYDVVDDYKINCKYSKDDNVWKGNLNINNEYITIDVGSIQEKIKR